MLTTLQVRAGLMFVGFQDRLIQLRDREEGQGLVEYGLILALIALAAVVALTGLGTTIANKLSGVASKLT